MKTRNPDWFKAGTFFSEGKPGGVLLFGEINVLELSVGRCTKMHTSGQDPLFGLIYLFQIFLPIYNSEIAVEGRIVTPARWLK